MPNSSILIQIDMAERHESSFSYPLTRAYPFKWFTWTVTIGGIAAAVLFSVLNFAANGFTLAQVYSTDPNTTLAASHWYDRAPFTLMSISTTSCQPLNIAVKSRVFTTHFGWVYTVSNISTHFNTDQVAIQPSLNYLNNTLSNCTVDRIRLNAVNSNTAGNDPYYAWETSKYTVSATCGFDNGTHPAAMSLEVEWYPQTYQVNNDPLEFVRPDKTAHANLWWARAMLWPAYFEMNRALANMDPSKTISRARIDLIPTGNGSLSDYSFFQTDCRVLAGNGLLIGDFQDMGDTVCGFDLGSPLDRMGKLLYSTVMADLGSTTMPNILGKHDTLQKFLAGFSGLEYLYTMQDSDIRNAYDLNNADADDLTVTNARLYAQYSCQVSVRKGVGSMLIGVLIADLVLLQALWLVFNWTLATLLAKRDATSNFCAGCVMQQDNVRPARMSNVSDGYNGLADKQESFTNIRRKPVPMGHELTLQDRY